jgi:hypothetical protein
MPGATACSTILRFPTRRRVRLQRLRGPSNWESRWAVDGDIASLHTRRSPIESAPSWSGLDLSGHRGPEFSDSPQTKDIFVLDGGLLDALCASCHRCQRTNV